MPEYCKWSKGHPALVSTCLPVLRNNPFPTNVIPYLSHQQVWHCLSDICDIYFSSRFLSVRRAVSNGRFPFGFQGHPPKPRTRVKVGTTSLPSREKSPVGGGFHELGVHQYFGPRMTMANFSLVIERLSSWFPNHWSCSSDLLINFPAEPHSKPG